MSDIYRLKGYDMLYIQNMLKGRDHLVFQLRRAASAHILLT